MYKTIVFKKLDFRVWGSYPQKQETIQVSPKITPGYNLERISSKEGVPWKFPQSRHGAEKVEKQRQIEFAKQNTREEKNGQREKYGDL